MYNSKPFIPFGLDPAIVARLVDKLQRRGFSPSKAQATAEATVQAKAPQYARLILTWEQEGRTYHRDCKGRFADLKVELTPEYLISLKDQCDRWAQTNGGQTVEIWVSADGPVLCWRNAEAGWVWLR